MKELPDVDIKELQKLKERNFQDRLAFLDRYVEWLKRTPNKKWSAEQKEIVGKR